MVLLELGADDEIELDDPELENEWHENRDRRVNRPQAVDSGDRQLGDGNVVDIDISDVVVAGGEEPLRPRFLIPTRFSRVLAGASDYGKGKANARTSP